MKTYELTYIISSGLSSDEIDGVVKEIDSFISSQQGVIVSAEKTHAKPLSYRIKKQSSGYFVTTTMQMEEAGIKPLQEKLNHEKAVLRHMVMVKKPIKFVKERRTRKPLVQAEAATGKETDKKADPKINPADLDKKLEEILKD